MTVIDYMDGWLDPIAGESKYQFQERVDTVRNNGAQMAHVGIVHETKGVGDFAVPTAVDFGVQFAGKPTMSYGSEIIKFPDPKHYHYPRATASVYQWVEDSKGFITGAKIVYMVDVPPQDTYIQTQLSLLNARINLAFRKAQMDAAQNIKRVQDSTISDVEIAQAQLRVVQQQSALAQAQAAADAQVPKASDLVVHHNLRFYGMALKKLPDALMSALNTIASSGA